MEWIRQIDFQEIGVTALRLLLAALCGGLIGMERGRHNRPAGLRTHMLVCIASALVMLTNERYFFLYGAPDPTRMAAQVISGIGFLGTGTILIDKQNKVRGLTTAAGLWASSCLGLAIGAGYYSGAVIACLLTLTVFVKFVDIEKRFGQKSHVMEIYVELADAFSLNNLVEELTKRGFKVIDFDRIPSSGKKKDESAVKAHIALWVPGYTDHENVLQQLEDFEGLDMIEEVNST